MDFERELHRLADLYRGQGYRVTIRPGPEELPPFAKDFKVEIVGRRGDDGVLVAAKRNRTGVAGDVDMTRYAEVTGAQKGWRFDLAVLEAEEPGAGEAGGERDFSGEEIDGTLSEAQA